MLIMRTATHKDYTEATGKANCFSVPSLEDRARLYDLNLAPRMLVPGDMPSTPQLTWVTIPCLDTEQFSFLQHFAAPTVNALPPCSLLVPSFFIVSTRSDP